MVKDPVVLEPVGSPLVSSHAGSDLRGPRFVETTRLALRIPLPKNGSDCIESVFKVPLALAALSFLHESRRNMDDARAVGVLVAMLAAGP